MKSSIKHWCTGCEELHRVPTHLLKHAICCVECGGDLSDQPSQSRAKAPEPNSPQATWLRPALPYLAGALLTGIAAAVKFAGGRPISAMVSAMLCVASLGRVLILIEQHSEDEAELAFA